MRRCVAVGLWAAILLGGATASAQERGQIGLTMGYPAAIGVLWHASDRLGIRAEATFQTSSSELESGPIRSDRDVESTSFAVGVAGLFYLGRSDDVSTYFSPRLAYTRSTSEVEGPEVFLVPQLFPVPIPPIPLELRTESSGYSVGGSFGGQYSPNRRFSIFGELGLNYATLNSESSSFASSETEASSFGVRSAVGIVLYFN
jgi:hypothetical protein